MTSSKAIGGAVSAQLVTVTLWLLTLIPGWDTVPDEPRMAIAALVLSGIGYLVVYYSPANRDTMTTPEGISPSRPSPSGPGSLT